ncbi:hypothetical protein BCT30_13710 [Enterovibrio norvegicus]|uniref:hypothetical protein n=1 Tax=Enterovibrio norvegicus TaxID=188144 RepID=UPI000C860E2C|nr:hypothetical protein [Enterovibrio norvegicus]PMN52181.1 hypothetical protein BCT30_13710 [Enterovibrio norvegicus]
MKRAIIVVVFGLNTSFVNAGDLMCEAWRYVRPNSLSETGFSINADVNGEQKIKVKDGFLSVTGKDGEFIDVCKLKSNRCELGETEVFINLTDDNSYGQLVRMGKGHTTMTVITCKEF